MGTAYQAQRYLKLAHQAASNGNYGAAEIYRRRADRILFGERKSNTGIKVFIANTEVTYRGRKETV